MKLFWNYLKNYKKLLVLALVLTAINQVFSLMEPQLFRILIDNYVVKVLELEPNIFLKGAALVVLGKIGVAMVSRIAKNFQDYYVSVISERMGAKMYAESVSHSFSLPFQSFEDQRSGELLQKLQKARDDSKVLVNNAINSVFFLLVGILFVIGYAFYVHWIIGLVYFLTVPVLGGTFISITKRIKKSQEYIVKESASLAGSTTETIRNVELVKSLGLESQEISRLNNVNDKILDLELKKVKLIRTLSFVQGTLINLIRSAIILLVAWMVYLGNASLGEFYTLYVYSFFVFSPLYELGNIATQYQEAKASNENLREVLRVLPEENPKNSSFIKSIKNIEFKSVDFKYQTAQSEAVQNIDAKISSGQTVAFVGPSGSGKTTLVKLLVGLYKPVSGSISFNGVSGSKIDFSQLRKKIGLVAQETQLFSGTIRENLLFVKPNATDKECMKAIEAAQAVSIVERGSGGLSTKIGEGGLKLSGGERQRLAIARALLRAPELLIFDEATSSLDSITEKGITKTIQDIEKSQESLTTVLVAHRLSTVMHADTIFVLEKGKIIEHGTHSQLVDKKGLYYALWREQVATNK